MNSLVIFFAVLACAFAQYGRPPTKYQPSGGNQIGIVRQSSELNPDGSYQWSYETENGIAAQEQGGQKGSGENAGTAAQGSFHYTALDGTPIALQYIADENGFQPQGAHLPQAPPIPEAILRAIAYNEAHPQRDEPAYKPGRPQY